ncbi:MAG: hypothetical protein FVQ85_20315 [Planctomycetes bacterium]|nr:hypothetical protein [Planctomycetota bacterium]
MGLFSKKPDQNKIDYFKLYSYKELFHELITHKHWKNLNIDIIKQVFKKAQSDLFAQPNEGIEVLKHFIYVSEKYNLVEDQFLRLASTTHDLDILLGYFSFHLYRLGSDLAKRFFSSKTEEEIKGYGMQADMAFMSSILCDEYMLPSYAGMAFLHGEIHINKDVALEFCAKYKAIEDKLLNTPDNDLSPLQLSKKELLDPKNMHKTMERIKQYAPGLLPNDSVAEDEEMSQRDYIEQLEKKLLQL